MTSPVNGFRPTGIDIVNEPDVFKQKGSTGEPQFMDTLRTRGTVALMLLSTVDLSAGHFQSAAFFPQYRQMGLWAMVTFMS